MAVKYYGWLGVKGYNGLVKVVDNSQAYVFDKKTKDFKRNDDYLKAAWDPSSDFDAISDKDAADLIKKLSV